MDQFSAVFKHWKCLAVDETNFKLKPSIQNPNIITRKIVDYSSCRNMVVFNVFCNSCCAGFVCKAMYYRLHVVFAASQLLILFRPTEPIKQTGRKHTLKESTSIEVLGKK